MQRDISFMLTNGDLQILDSYKRLASMLAYLLGNTCECVLHSLDQRNSSIIFIHNGELTGRHLGSPLSSRALRIVEQWQDHGTSVFGPFKSSGINGQQLRSVCFVISNYETPAKAIGILCLNLNVDIPITDLVHSVCNFDPSQIAQTQPRVVRDCPPKGKSHNTLSNEAKRYITKAVEQACTEVMDSPWIPKRNRNGIIIRKLYSQGLFQVRHSISEVASLLHISKDAVYMHIRKINLKREEQKQQQ